MINSPEYMRAWRANRRATDPEGVKRRDREYREKNKEKLRENDRRWREQNPEVARGCSRAKTGRWRERHPEVRAEQVRRERQTAQGRARLMLNHAVRRGKIAKPVSCTACGDTPGSRRMHGHHADYSQPLVVTWLCSVCHGLLHRSEVPS